MSVHIVSGFLEHFDKYDINYENSYTLQELNNYISECYSYESSNWKCGDLIRVPVNQYSGESWDGVRGLFVWNGYSAIYPFYNGNCNSSNYRAKRVDVAVSREGFIPNSLKLFDDYDPSEIFGLENGINSRIGFYGFNSDDYGYDYFDERVVRVGDVSVIQFDYNKFIVFIGDFDYNIYCYLTQCRPYDLDANEALSSNFCETSIYDIVDEISADYDSHFMFIHPCYLNIDFDCESYTECTGNNIGKSDVYIRQTKPSFKPKIVRSQCLAVKADGYRCTKKTKENCDYCGMHRKQMYN